MSRAPSPARLFLVEPASGRIHPVPVDAVDIVAVARRLEESSGRADCGFRLHRHNPDPETTRGYYVFADPSTRDGAEVSGLAIRHWEMIAFVEVVDGDAAAPNLFDASAIRPEGAEP